MNYSCFKIHYPTSKTNSSRIKGGPEKITKIAYVSFYTVVFYAEKWGLRQ